MSGAITWSREIGASREPDLQALRSDPRRAILESGIICLICGGIYRQLTNTHMASHATTTSQYKRLFGYNAGRPLMCRVLWRLYAERAVRSGLAARIGQRPILTDPDLRRRGGVRSIALEEALTRREVRQRAAERRVAEALVGWAGREARAEASPRPVAS